MKLWEKSIELDKRIEKFTIGKDKILDLKLASHDVNGSIAHAKMLQQIGVLSPEELSAVLAELNHILEDIKAGQFQIENGIEDVHSQIELLLTRKLGDIGKKIHTGRSRNDQVMLDLRLYFREQLQDIIQLSINLSKQFLDESDHYHSILMPGYTHTQVAMVSSVGLWLASFGESLTDDIQILKTSLEILNKNPLGSAAGYGSSFPIDRSLTTEILAFKDLCYNSIYAQSGRGKSELIAANALASLAITISRFANDICLFSNQNFNFLQLPDELTTGSSIMPHKKNPDVFELIRAKCNQLKSVPGQIMMVCSNLTTGYHRDFQVLKETIIPAFEECKDILSITHYCLPKIKFNPNILDDPKYDHIYSVEEVNNLVIEGKPFREAYQIVADQIQRNVFNPTKEIVHTHIGSVGNPGNSAIRKILKELES